MKKNTIKKHVYRPQQAAEALSTSLRTLARWRAEGIGPPYFVVGSNIYYPRAQMIRWISRQVDGPEGYNGAR